MRNAFVVAVFVLSALSAAATTLEAFDARLEKDLRTVDASTVALWQQANAARDAGNHAEAMALYGQVYARVPGFTHALRRMAAEQLAAGNRDLALKNMRDAVGRERSPENLAMLASALVAVKDGELVPQDAAKEALSLARESVLLAPRETHLQMTLAQVAIATNDLDTLRGATGQLELLAPEEPGTHLMRVTVDASDGKWTDAEAALDRARDAGLPPAAYDSMRANLRSSIPFYIRWWKPAALALVAWFGGFAILLLAGLALSRIALHAARETPSDLSANATNLSSKVRKTYATVLFLCSLFYYISVPIVIALVVAVGGGVIYASFAIGRIPIKIVIIAVVIVGVTIWSILKSLFVRASDEDPGNKVDLAVEPRLRQLLDDVAARIGTRAVDNVYLTPGTEVAVMERGRKSPKERCLILGVAALDGLAMRQFKAVLGHEYGHFTNRDTAGGTLTYSVRNSLIATATGLAEGGAAAWYNPAWLFVNGFNRVFLRISEGASRLQEVLADRWAVFAYGASAFESGLRHIVERGVRFDAHVGVTLKEVVDAQVPLANLYTYTPSNAVEDLTEAIEQAMSRKSSAYDSHPSPNERFELVRALPHDGSERSDDDLSPAWSLFTDPLGVQQTMTAQVRENVRANYGVEIAAPVQETPGV